MPILSWLDREQHTRAIEQVPYRLLEAEDEHSAGDTETANMLIQGDNLEALKSLLPYYAGTVQCTLIDPPYNTKGAFEHHDDSLEHSKWLGMMFPRLELLSELLADEGSVWMTIDDNEAHYLKVMMDEVFGRRNSLANCVWQKRTSPDVRINLGGAHDHILVYAKNVDKARLNKSTISESQRKNFKNKDNDPKGPWASTDFTAQGFRKNQMYTITTPQGQNTCTQKDVAGRTLSLSSFAFEVRGESISGLKSLRGQE